MSDPFQPLSLQAINQLLSFPPRLILNDPWMRVIRRGPRKASGKDRTKIKQGRKANRNRNRLRKRRQK